MKIAGTLLAGLSAAAVIALPTAGHAAAGASVQVSGETIVYTAGDGERNAVTVFSGSGEITSLSGRINAGTGDDAYFAGRALGATGITFSGGEGEDFVVHGSTAVRASLDGVAGDGRQATGDKDNILTDVEHITGSSQGDVLAGSGARNRIEGGPGADELYGLGGADTILAKDSTTTRDLVISCGDGTDSATVDAVDVPSSGCETVTR